jgi:hypothetical protein
MPVTRRRSWIRWTLTPVLLGAAALPLHAADTPVSAAGMTHPAAVSLSSLVLSARDVRAAYGSGFKLVVSREITNRLAAASAGIVPGAGSLLTGRVTGWSDSYLRIHYVVHGQKVTVSPGVNTVASGVNLYKAAQYARAALTYAMHARVRQQKGLTVQQSSLTRVGEAALLEVTRTVATGIPPLYSVVIAFLRGRYTASVDVSAYSSKPTTSSALNLARLIDGRLRSHPTG